MNEEEVKEEIKEDNTITTSNVENVEETSKENETVDIIEDANQEENKDNIIENIEENAEVEEVNEKTLKEVFEERLEKIRTISGAVELHNDVKKAVEEEKVENNYLKYLENSLEDKLFSNTDTKGILAKVLIEIICQDLCNIENFDENKLQIENIGSHFEEQENFIDKICMYDNKLITVFGTSENNPTKVLKYDARKFSRVDMIEAVKAQYEEGKTVKMYQYDEYYVGIEEDRVKIFSERKITALVKVEETIFDKIKLKLSNLFTKKKFKYCPNLELIYDSNPNRIKEFEHKTKFDAKSRMKFLLSKEREVTRSSVYVEETK